ncbi:Hypothetical protein, putative, partial [Bodo saltans]
PVHSSGGLKFMPASRDESSLFTTSAVNNASFAISMPATIAATSAAPPPANEDSADSAVVHVAPRRQQAATARRGGEAEPFNNGAAFGDE